MAAEGKGRVVHADGFIADVKYKIVNSQEFSLAGTPTFKSRKLYLFDCSPEIPFAATAFTLEMDNGEKLNFFVRRFGEFEPTGEIYR
jgi:hypothetical protein